MSSGTSNIRRLVFSAMLAALACICTMVIQIPVPATGGYINLGDSIVLLCAWYIGGVYGAAAAGIGTMLADMLSGYAIYAPATFVIKACMALAAWAIFRKFHSHRGQYLGAVAAALIMMTGYLLYESLILGLGLGAFAAIPANLIQGFTGCVGGVVLSLLMEKNAFLRNMLHTGRS
ncbi:MAG: ECF transporter S component [Oscillospiraceae bacterium]|nr:ECF transporter S component [Oscillospiraceae bacterium]